MGPARLRGSARPRDPARRHADGVEIACEVSGAGPPLVLVHGAGSARWGFALLRPQLERRFTVIAIDRRGRGDSTDGDGVRARARVRRTWPRSSATPGAPARSCSGHSYGGLVAAGAASSSSLPRLVLYEPPMGGDAHNRRDDRALGVADRGGRPRHGGARVPRGDRRLRRAEIEEMARSPVWELRRRSPTRFRASCAPSWRTRFDARGLGGARHAGADARRQREPGLGAPLDRRATRRRFPDAETRRLEGHGHGADVTAPELLAGELEHFFLEA